MKKRTGMALVFAGILYAGVPDASAASVKVKSGDTLYSLSVEHHVTVADIKNWNQLKTNTIKVGQTLHISSPVNGTATGVYTVQKGDTLYGISKKVGLSVQQIKTMNGLKTDVIKVGQVIKTGNDLFIRPADGSLTSGYSNRVHPITGKDDFHHGVDFAQKGTVAIKAAAAGVVSKSYVSKTYGETVFILHNLGGKTYETVYAHMKEGSRKVKQGDKVIQGQPIGYMGSTGSSTSQHLHFELHEGRWNIDKTNAVDPMTYLK